MSLYKLQHLPYNILLSCISMVIYIIMVKFLKNNKYINEKYQKVKINNKISSFILIKILIFRIELRQNNLIF